MVVPYKGDQEGKKAQVARMFDSISSRYDFLNHVLSLGIDIYWRKRMINRLKDSKPKLILDIATGTADLAIEASKLNPMKIIGVDISDGMLEIGRKKIKRKGLAHLIELQNGDSEQLVFDDNKFDAVIVAFGVRNFENLETGLNNIYRVLKENGELVVLEFSKPSKFPFKQLYNFYFKAILPFIGRLISRDSSAYSYLPASVSAFPDGQKFLHILDKTGFKNTSCDQLTFGVSSIYFGTK